jgi:hypothetical protein
VDALEFPAQASLVRPLIESDSGSANAAFMPLYAGQAAPLIRNLPAAKLIEKLVTEIPHRLLDAWAMGRTA